MLNSKSKKYTRAKNAKGVGQARFVERLNELVTEPTRVDIRDIDVTSHDIYASHGSDGTIVTLEEELAFLSNTIKSIASLKKSEKFLKQRVNALSKCLVQLKSIRQEISDVGLLLDTSNSLTSIAKPDIINSSKDEDISTSNDLDDVAIVITKHPDSTTQNIQDFE